MTKQFFKKNPIFKVFHSTLIGLPAPSNLSLLWNFGSLLSLCLIMQIITGLLLASNYAPSMSYSFEMVFKSMEMTDSGWLVRYVHSNGASLFFLAMYLHIGRGLYYGSYIYTHTWMIGVTILLLSMATAFLGYVLPVNQMSFWGASVITNLFSELPYIGPNVVQLLWGGVSIDDPTITRFFSFHFILPFVILALVIAHITFLHMTGSSNPMGVTSDMDKIKFHHFYSVKDVTSLLTVFLIFISLCLYLPLILGDNENFVLANPSTTPHQIKPEWYFLFAYTILRSIPNKLGGILALMSSILILYAMPFTFIAKFKSLMFYPYNTLNFWLFVCYLILLTWLGARPLNDKCTLHGQIFTALYFSQYLTNHLIMKMWDTSVVR